MRKKSSADKLGEDKDGSEFKTWDADISITDTELSKLCTIHSATTKPSKVTPGTGSNKTILKKQLLPQQRHLVKLIHLTNGLNH